MGNIIMFTLNVHQRFYLIRDGMLVSNKYVTVSELPSKDRKGVILVTYGRTTKQVYFTTDGNRLKLENAAYHMTVLTNMDGSLSLEMIVGGVILEFAEHSPSGDEDFGVFLEEETNYLDPVWEIHVGSFFKLEHIIF